MPGYPPVINLDAKRNFGFSVSEREREGRISSWLVQIPFRINDVFVLLVNHMKILGSAFVSCWLEKSEPWHSLQKEWFSWGVWFWAIFFLFLYTSKVLGSVCSCLKSLTREVLIDVSIPYPPQEWDSRKSTLAVCETPLMSHFQNRCDLDLETN